METADDITLQSTDSCIICLESITEKASAVPCRHESFDFICLVSWLEEKPTCPLCKTKIEVVEYSRKSSKEVHRYAVKSTVERKDPIIASSTSRRLQQPSLPPRPPRRILGRERVPTPDEALLRRRHVYRHNLYSLHVGSNRLSRFQDITPAKFAQDQELISRARKWIRRELQVFEFLRPDSTGREGVTRRSNNAEFLLEYIVAILRTVPINGSQGMTEDMLQEFLGRDNTRLFLHELRAWLRSPYTRLDMYDQHVQYSENFSVSETTDESSVRQQDHRHQKRKYASIQNNGVQEPRRKLDSNFMHRRYDRYVPD